MPGGPGLGTALVSSGAFSQQRACGDSPSRVCRAGEGLPGLGICGIWSQAGMSPQSRGAELTPPCGGDAVGTEHPLHPQPLTLASGLWPAASGLGKGVRGEMQFGVWFEEV